MNPRTRFVLASNEAFAGEMIRRNLDAGFDTEAEARSAEALANDPAFTGMLVWRVTFTGIAGMLVLLSVDAVTSRPEPPPLARAVMLGAAALLALTDPAAAAEAAIEAPWTLGPVGAALLGLACAWIGAVVAVIAISIAKAGREDTYPILVKRGNHWPCRLAISEDRIICRECGEDSSNGTIPGCVMGEWSR